MTNSVRIVGTLAWQKGRLSTDNRAVPEETPVAFTYDGSTHAVMMATPDALEDFAVGFTLTEGIVGSIDEIEALEIIEEDAGIELRMRLAGPPSSALAARRRFLAGPVGCGLCGIESLAEVMRPLPEVAGGPSVSPSAIFEALAAIREGQAIHGETRAVHAAAFWRQDGGLIAVREDVGRHNALDKLAGALARQSLRPDDGLVLVTSRLSVELVQKAAMIGAPVLVAVSAPTALAIRTADAAGITIVAVARHDGFEVFSHVERIDRESVGHVVV